MKVYPIKFNPILKEKIWGGSKLGNLLGKNTNKDNVGESWEISGVEGSVSIVSNGKYKGKNLKELISYCKEDLVGARNFEDFGYNFPLLIKFLDAKTDLSVQVHPDDKMAKQFHDGFGKTEMWYIMDSDKNADIVLGLKYKDTQPEQLLSINAQNVEAVFNREKVSKGDSYFIPAGKIHAIGAGVLAAEIQQTSDITYRVYDWDRKDAQGNKRELHTKLAQKAVKKFDSNGKSEYSLKKAKEANLAKCDFFTTNIIAINESRTLDYTHLDSFVIYMCVEGTATITTGNYTEVLKMGETILLPALTEGVTINSKNAKLLEVYIGDKTYQAVQIAS